jgi:ABC-type dipeptide/oligopeptide/nickel transport system permease subunit
MHNAMTERTRLAPAERSAGNPRRWRSENQLVVVGRRLLRHRKGLIGVIALLLLTLVSIASPLIAPYDPNELHLNDQLAPPSAAYWFGTDELGRDIFSRVIYGARPAIQAGLSAVLLAAAIGILTGLIAGYLGGWLDSLVMRVWDTVLAFPAIFLAIGIVTILGPGWANAVLAIAIINMPVFSRVVRATTLSAKEKDFTEAARAIGCTQWQIIRRHLLPTCVAPGDRVDRHRRAGGNSDRGLAQLPRPGQPAAESLLGQHAQRGPGIPGAIRHLRSLPGPGDRRHRASNGLLCRWPPGRDRSSTRPHLRQIRSEAAVTPISDSVAGVAGGRPWI